MLTATNAHRTVSLTNVNEVGVAKDKTTIVGSDEDRDPVADTIAAMKIRGFDDLIDAVVYVVSEVKRGAISCEEGEVILDGYRLIFTAIAAERKMGAIGQAGGAIRALADGLRSARALEAHYTTAGPVRELVAVGRDDE